MQLTSLLFLFGFLPVSWILYSLVRKTKAANLFILAVSLLFYAFGSLRSLFILLFCLLWNYLCMKEMSVLQNLQKRKTLLIFCAGIDLLVLFFYRYLGIWFSFLDAWIPVSSLTALMPAGLSFYLFSLLSAVFDVYYRKAPAPNNFMQLGIYAAFFGRVNMGPIGNWESFYPQLDNHPLTKAKSYMGGVLLIQGLFRKVVLADNLGLVYTALAGNASWLGNLLMGFAYFFQLYFDFSGYSRMARGCASLFGFEIPVNFDRPYSALSVQDFWRRWHISLTSWFRNYVYIPLGGNRVTRPLWIRNILCVWLLTGLWHGATWSFLVWGLYQGGLILLEKFALNKVLIKMPSVMQHCYLILTQLVGWTFFSSATLTLALQRVGRYFFVGTSGFADTQSLFLTGSSWLLFVLAVLVCTRLPENLGRLILKKAGSLRFPVQCSGYVFELLLCLSLLISQSAQTFLYAAF